VPTSQETLTRFVFQCCPLDNGENNGLKNGVWRVDAERELLEANARDEAWRIAVNMAKLPDLLRKP
jgi:hypothetical protein